MKEFPVQPGAMLSPWSTRNAITEVADNRSVIPERDHFYCRVHGRRLGWFFGGRWVSTRALKDLRFPEKSAFAQPVDAGSFLSIYGVHKDHEQEAFDGLRVPVDLSERPGFPPADPCPHRAV